MKKYLLVMVALLLTAAVVMAAVLNNGKKAIKNEAGKSSVTKKDRSAKGSHCSFFSNGCY